MCSVYEPTAIRTPLISEPRAQVTGQQVAGQLTTSKTVQKGKLKLGESKKTAQRRIQRERARDYKAKSQIWPMTIECTPMGEIPKEVRTYVHAQFRATARRFLNLSVIHFRDHPDTDMQTVKDDLDRRFLFDPPLRSDYIIFFIENSLRTSRYLWRKHWVNTGKGEKHKFCPARFFPALVKYWKIAEAKEES